jgi:cytidylate kinase
LNPRITAFAEQQMRRWGQHQENVAREASFEEAGRLAAQDLSYVAISREAGAGASTIAQIVGSRLNWKVYDSNLLDEVAQRNKLPRFMLNLVDETVSNWLYDVFFPWMDSQVVSQEKFVVQVSRVIRTLSRGGNAVFVGRGAQFLLPRSKTLAVRIVAPEAFRAQYVEKRRHVGSQQALDSIRRTDRGRRDFNRHFFHHDISDPHLFDLVINAGQFSPAEAAEQIVQAVRRVGNRPDYLCSPPGANLVSTS